MQTLIIGTHNFHFIDNYKFYNPTRVVSIPSMQLLDITSDPMLLPGLLTDDAYDVCVLILNMLLDNVADIQACILSFKQTCHEFGVKHILFTDIPGRPVQSKEITLNSHVKLISTNVNVDYLDLSNDDCYLVAANIERTIINISIPKHKNLEKKKVSFDRLRQIPSMKFKITLL